MAAPMIPPADAPSFLEACGWAGARIEPDAHPGIGGVIPADVRPGPLKVETQPARGRHRRRVRVDRAQEVELLLRDVARDADGEAGAGERVAVHQAGRQA